MDNFLIRFVGFLILGFFAVPIVVGLWKKSLEAALFSLLGYAFFMLVVLILLTGLSFSGILSWLGIA